MEFIFCININDLVVNANLKTVVKREDLIKAASCTPALAAATAEMQMTPVCARFEETAKSTYFSVPSLSFMKSKTPAAYFIFFLQRCDCH